jgi:hypothetical protein
MAAASANVPNQKRPVIMKRQLTFLFLLIMALPAAARTISWFNAEGDVLAAADGSSTLDASFTFEIGTFGNSFIPTDQNLHEWSTYWKVFDRAVTGDGYNPTTDYFTSNATLQSNGQSSAGFGTSTFATDEVAYLWVYNSLNLLPSSEWALVRDSSNDSTSAWAMPVSDVGNPSSLDWDLFNADSSVFGQVNGFMGGGIYTPISEPLGVAWLQTAAVPEPSSAMFLILTATLAMRRRVRG